MKNRRTRIVLILFLTAVIPLTLFSMGLSHYSDLMESSRSSADVFAAQANEIKSREQTFEEIGNKFQALSDYEQEMIKSYGLMKLTMIFALIATGCSVLVRYVLLKNTDITHNQKSFSTAEKNGEEL